MRQHVLAIREDDVAFGTRVLPGDGHLLIVPHVISLKMPGNVFAERIKILERSTALGAQ
jgi:hypothetical protein